MRVDPNRIVVTETHCGACRVPIAQVFHRDFAGIRVEARSASEAAADLVGRLTDSIRSTVDPLLREAARSALADTQAFLDAGVPPVPVSTALRSIQNERGLSQRQEESSRRAVPTRDEDRPMDTDPRRVIVTEKSCHSCSVHTIEVHHAHLPELRLLDTSAEKAARRLVDRLEAAGTAASDALHRETVQRVIDDLHAFLNREGPFHLGRDLKTQAVSS